MFGHLLNAAISAAHCPVSPAPSPPPPKDFSLTWCSAVHAMDENCCVVILIYLFICVCMCVCLFVCVCNVANLSPRLLKQKQQVGDGIELCLAGCALAVHRLGNGSNPGPTLHCCLQKVPNRPCSKWSPRAHLVRTNWEALVMLSRKSSQRPMKTTPTLTLARKEAATAETRSTLAHGAHRHHRSTWNCPTMRTGEQQHHLQGQVCRSHPDDGR